MKGNNYSNIAEREVVLIDPDELGSDFNKDDFTIIVPVLNEEDAIDKIITRIMNEGYNNILVIDGYSKDNTVNIAATNGVKVFYQHGIGKTGAIETALDHVKTPYIVIIDGDCTYDPSDIRNFYPHIKFNDEVIGIRKHGRTNIPAMNRFGNWIINFAFNLLFGSNLKDVCSGLYALKTPFAKMLELKTDGFEVEVEIAAQATIHGKITQVPINYYSRVGQQKLQPVKHGIKIFGAIWNLSRIYNPVFLFSMIATLLVIPAMAILSWVIIETFKGSWHAGLALLGVTLLLISIQTFVLSTISTLLKRQEHRIMARMRNTSNQDSEY